MALCAAPPNSARPKSPIPAANRFTGPPTPRGAMPATLSQSKTNAPPEGQPLLAPVMRAGARLAPAPPALAESQARCRAQVECLPAALRVLAPCESQYPVRHSARLEQLLAQVRERVTSA